MILKNGTVTAKEKCLLFVHRFWNLSQFCLMKSTFSDCSLYVSRDFSCRSKSPQKETSRISIRENCATRLTDQITGQRSRANVSKPLRSSPELRFQTLILRLNFCEKHFESSHWKTSGLSVMWLSPASAHISCSPAISFRGQSERNESINSKALKSQIH